MEKYLYIFVGGGVGSIMRYLTTIAAEHYFKMYLPIATFSANVLGSLLIGIFIGLFEHGSLSSTNVRLLLLTGFCGGYTTFSTFSAENLTLLQAGNYIAASLYILFSVVTGIVAVFLGVAISDMFNI